jgi:hypothetical protein
MNSVLRAMSRLSVITTSAERMLLALIAALVLAVHAGGLIAPAWVIRAIPLGMDFQELLPATQVVLLAAWAVLGPGPLWVRLPATPVLLFIWAAGWSSGGWERASLRTIDELLLATGAVALVMAIVIRCYGLKISGDRDAARTARLLPQFSIRGLIVLTTLVAIVLGALEWLRPTLGTQSDFESYTDRIGSTWHHWLTAPSSLRRAIMAAALAGASLAGMWCVLRPGLVWPRMILSVGLAAVLGVYLVHVAGSDRGPAVGLSISLAMYTMLAAASALPLRLAGVRLARPRRTGFQPVVSQNSKGRLKACPAKLVPETSS